MKVEFEFADETSLVIRDVHPDEADQLVDVYECRVGDRIVSAWQDDAPWFGLCTTMREGVA